MHPLMTQPLIDQYLLAEDIHETGRQKRSGSIVLTLLVGAVLAVLHGINLYYLLWMQNTSDDIYTYPQAAVSIFLLVHLLLVLVAYLFARVRFGKSRNDLRYDLLLVLSTLTMGVFGAVGTVTSILFFVFFQRFALSFAQWFQSIFPQTNPTLPEAIYDDILTGRDESAKRYSVMPFLDVMVVGSEAQKREALSKMTSMFHPNFAPAFHRALADENNSIRVQAATSIAKIENQFLERAMQLETLAREHPKDDALILALARHYDEYAYTGILDSEREETNRARALEIYDQYLSRHPNDVQARLYLGRLLLRSGRTERAAEWLRQSIDAGHATAQMIGWYMECLYKLGRYHELRQFAARAPVATNDNDGSIAAIQPALNDSLSLWNGSVAGSDWKEAQAHA